MNGNIKQSPARLSSPRHSAEVRQREVEALGLLHGGAVYCAVPVPPASYATWARGAGQKGPEMLWLWPVQVASACCRNVTAPPSPLPWVSTSKLALDVCAGPVGAQAEVARLWGAPCCLVCAPGCHKSPWQCGFTPGHGHCRQLLWVLALCGGGALSEEGSAPGGSQPSGHPPSTLGHSAGSQSPGPLLRCGCPELPLSPAAWLGPPMPVSDHGCLSPSRVSAGPGPHPLERATRAALWSWPLRCCHHHSPTLRCYHLPPVHLRAGARGHHPPAPAGRWGRYVTMQVVPTEAWQVLAVELLFMGLSPPRRRLSHQRWPLPSCAALAWSCRGIPPAPGLARHRRHQQEVPQAQVGSRARPSLKLLKGGA